MLTNPSSFVPMALDIGHVTMASRPSSADTIRRPDTAPAASMLVLPTYPNSAGIPAKIGDLEFCFFTLFFPLCVEAGQPRLKEWGGGPVAECGDTRKNVNRDPGFTETLAGCVGRRLWGGGKGAVRVLVRRNRPQDGEETEQGAAPNRCSPQGGAQEGNQAQQVGEISGIRRFLIKCHAVGSLSHARRGIELVLGRSRGLRSRVCIGGGLIAQPKNLTILFMVILVGAGGRS